MNKERELHWVAVVSSFVAGSIFHQAVRELWPVVSAVAAIVFILSGFITQPKEPSR